MTDTPPKRPRGRLAVVSSINDAERELELKKRGRDDPPPTQPRGGIKPNRKGAPPNWTANWLGLPKEEPCPVVPLGTEQIGGAIVYHMLSSNGHFVSYAASDFSHAGMQSLFGATPNYPAWAWPRHGKPYKIKNADGAEEQVWPIETFADDLVRQAMMLACERSGLFTAAEKLRGRGMWTDRAGDVIYHAGEQLWRFDRARGIPVAFEPGFYEGYLYPRMEAVPAPWDQPIAPLDNPVKDLLAGLQAPFWTRPEVDPILLLGWHGVAYYGAALKWRSSVLLLGGHGTGKSTLQHGLRELFGAALFRSANTSPAGIYQRMRNDARPIALDELEPDTNPARVRDTVHLMRQSASGDIGYRGSSGGEATSFSMNSAFLFSAINNPLHESQDASRCAVLRLNEIPPGAKAPAAVVNPETLGRMMLHILMREWPRFARTFAVYRDTLAAAGHTARGQDTYGTLLAAADVLIGEELADQLGLHTAFSMEDPMREDTAGLTWWKEHLGAAALPEVEDAHQNWLKCATWILTAPVEPWRNGKRSTVGQLLAEIGTFPDDVAEAKRDLAATGLGLLVPGDVAEKEAGWVLAVPNDHPLLRKLFKDSVTWTAGGWKDALRQCPADGVMLTDKDINKVSIGGVQMRCTLIVMGRFHKAAER